MKILSFSNVVKTFALSAAVVLSLTACSSSSSSSSSTSSSNTSLAYQSQPSKADETASNSSIQSFEDINSDKVKLIALGNSDVPVGQYSEEILTSMGIWDSIQSKISFGTNVKEVLSQVSSGSVDCGIVYATDAATEPDVSVVAIAPADSMKTPVVYPAAMLKNSKNADASKAFLNFLLTDTAKTEFEKVGFKMAADTKNENTKSDASTTLTIFAAASLTESLTEIGNLFKEQNPDIKLVFNFDSSGTLKTQIESGAEADIFISAAQKQMTGLSEGGYIDDDTKVDLLENEVVLIVPKK